MRGGRREGERSAICAVTVPVLPGAAGAGLDSTRARLQRRVHPCPRRRDPRLLRRPSEARPGAPRRPPDARRSSTASPGRRSPPTASAASRRCKLFEEDLAPACISTDHPRYLSFIPCAPTEAAAMFDLVVGASSIYGGSWLEGAGAVYAENQALRWIADLVGLPAGGRRRLRARRHHRQPVRPRRRPAYRPGQAPCRRAAPAPAPDRGASPRRTAAHSSIQSACDVMDAELVGVQVDEHWRLTGRAPARGAARARPRDVLRRRRHERHDQLRHRRRPRLGRRGLPRVRHLVPRRRRLRRCRPRRPLGAPPLRRHRARGLVHRRPAQVAVRAVRLLRAALPRARRWPAPRTPSTRPTSTCSPRPPTGTRPTTRSG